MKEDSAYVKGESAISYDTIAKPEVKKDNRMYYIIGGVVIFAADFPRLLFRRRPARALGARAPWRAGFCPSARSPTKW